MGVFLEYEAASRAAARILDFILAAIFIYAGVVKVLDPIASPAISITIKLCPGFLGGPRLLSALAGDFCGLALIFRFLYRGGLWILGGLTLVFIGAAAVAKVRGLDITCGCFGHASRHWSFAGHLALDLGILRPIIVLWFCQLMRGRNKPISRSIRHKTDPMIRKLKSGKYRLYSRKKNPKTGKRRNLGTFKTKAAAKKHEKAVQFFKRR